MLDGLIDLVTGSPLTYLLVAGLVAGDAILPLFPGETAVVVAGVLAADGALIVWLVLAAAAGGAFVGDLTAYLIGRGVGGRLVRRIERSEKGRRRLDKAREAVKRRGMGLIVTAQFLPGGRNVVMIAAGSLNYPLRRFLLAEGIGAVLWSAFQTGIGYLGGRTFASTWTALIVSVAVGIAFGAGVEVGGRLWRRHKGSGRRASPEPA